MSVCQICGEQPRVGSTHCEACSKAKIAVIKEVRVKLGLSLKQAKDLIDAKLEEGKTPAEALREVMKPKTRQLRYGVFGKQYALVECREDGEVEAIYIAAQDGSILRLQQMGE